MNWTDRPVVQIAPGKLSGTPVIVRLRVRPDDLIVNREEGPEWLAENFSLPLETVRVVLAFYVGAPRKRISATTMTSQPDR